MSKIEGVKGMKFVHFREVSGNVTDFEKGHVNINIHKIPTEEFESISELLNMEIQENTGARWICFSRARDGSRVTLFEA